MAEVSPVGLLMEEMDTDDTEAKTRAVKKIKTVAAALGPERTRNELIPFINESTDDEDEVLLLLAEQLGFLAAMVGGAEHVSCLLEPLEALASVEETVVREKAAESIALAISIMTDSSLTAVPLVSRLAAGDWFTSRISACALVAPAYAKAASAERKAELRALFAQLSADETPMVKRAAATHLGAFAKVVEKEVLLSEVLDIFKKQAQDDQDSVRLLAIEACVSFSELLDEGENEAHVLPVVHASVEDRSWRVRYNVAKQFHPLSAAMGINITMADMLGSFLNLLQDAEAEVRTAAAKNVAGYCHLVGTEPFVLEVVPALQVLAQDTVQNVRSALSEAVMELAAPFGQELAAAHLVPLIARFLQDEAPEVRLNVLTRLSLLADWMEPLSESLMPSVLELVKDAHWRVRLAIVSAMPVFMQSLGTAYFTSNMLPALEESFADSVAKVRLEAANALIGLHESAGSEWLQTNIMPSLKEKWESSTYYLQRITVLEACKSLGKTKIAGDLMNDVTELTLKGLSDAVPNVRFAACEAANSLFAQLDASGLPPFKSKLEGLLTDDDQDVKFYATQALEACAA